MAEITTTATDVQIPNDFDSDVAPTLILAGSFKGDSQKEIWDEEA